MLKDPFWLIYSQLNSLGIVVQEWRVDLSAVCVCVSVNVPAKHKKAIDDCDLLNLHLHSMPWLASVCSHCMH